VRKKLLSILLVIVLLVGLVAPASASSAPVVDTAIANAVGFLLQAVTAPTINSVGGEWAVIGLARSGNAVPDAFFENYFRAVEQQVRAQGGVLDARRLTEYSRVILGLTAAGFDPRSVAGFDLTLPLGDFDRTIWQGINGPVFALLALDSLNYAIPTNASADVQATRALYVAEILRRQTPDGGWNLTAGILGAPVAPDEVGDADLTGMALQALAKYQSDPAVRAATERALQFLSQAQDASGGFSSGFSPGASAVESAVQVLVALTELGISVNDPRFVKGGNTLVDNILSFQNPDGSFRHTYGNPEANVMSTEQALYGLVAARRALRGSNSLYRMSDRVVRVAGRHPDVRSLARTRSGTFPDIQNHPNRLAIEALYAREIIHGRSATERIFAPDATLTRAEFAAIITRGLGLPTQTTSVFADVPQGSWFHAPVGTAFFYGLVNGTSPTTFNPQGTITRQEAAVMILRGARLSGLDTRLSAAQIQQILGQFGDHSAVGNWAREAVAFCYHAGILDNTGDIRPQVPISRAEIAEMLYRLLDLANLL